MKKFFLEFQAFMAKGNVLDLAIAFMITAAFQKIVSSLVNQILMPLIAWLVKTDLSQWYFTLQEGVAVVEEESLLLNPPSGWLQAPIRMFYGSFIQSMIDFLIIAFILFFIFKIIKWSETLRLKIKEDLTQQKTRSTKKPSKS
jgi:large conductance mechanosensitive channel